jgi:hypothetical protein
VLFGQDGADQADEGVTAGEDPDDVGAAADLPVESFLRVVGPDLPPDGLGEGGEGQDVGAGSIQVRGYLRSLPPRASRTRPNWACTDSASGWS